MKKLSNLVRSFKSLDLFGVDIVQLNFKGRTNHQTILGSICTLCLAALAVIYTYQSFSWLINRDDPDYSFFKLTLSRDKENPLNLPDVKAQMYIGFRQTI